MSERTLGQRLGELLLGQVPDAPEWVRSVLEGREEPSRISEQGAGLRVERETGEWFEVLTRVVVPTTPPEGRATWDPRIRVPSGELEDFSYIVVDEIVGDTADVSVVAWPQVDERGRLRFGDDEPLRVRADPAAFGPYLRRATARRRRPLAGRTGDVFAAKVDKEALERLAREDQVVGPPPDPADWLSPPVYDISESAREKAKAAFFAAVAPTLTERQARQMKRAPGPEG